MELNLLLNLISVSHMPSRFFSGLLVTDQTFLPGLTTPLMLNLLLVLINLVIFPLLLKIHSSVLLISLLVQTPLITLLSSMKTLNVSKTWDPTTSLLLTHGFTLLLSLLKLVTTVIHTLLTTITLIRWEAPTMVN